MDMRLKERLVGAVVLVLAAVLFIPMVLDGPDNSEKVSRAVALPDLGQPGTSRTVRIDLDADMPLQDRGVPVPAVAAPELASVDLTPSQEQAAARESETPLPAAVQAGEEPVDEPVVQEKPATALPWTVQAGSFSRDDNAEALAAKLRGLGFPAYVSRFDDGERVHFRVRVGGFPSREAAQSRADEIRAKTGEPARPAPNR
ncbi:MAG TPA: SPOR domain-containing protein [Gammaproteobacteria bacterium]